MAHNLLSMPTNTVIYWIYGSNEGRYFLFASFRANVEDTKKSRRLRLFLVLYDSISSGYPMQAVSPII
ncbi:hypothetical protein DQG23_25410 [Paenibacillus contaminans]|uniref:Uncharacterized protein n=1 Tax=Paenibacillus contaminans TaxID=450362 RepID=A0A329MFI0_9BACL|nr:hypothetical protein DQG23_25410 [Paenibacillus contaminans]